MADVVEDLSKTQSRNLEAVPPAPVTRKSPVKYIVLGMLALAAIAGTWAWFHFRDRISSDDAQVDAHIVAIAPKISGNVTEVLVRDNQQVKAGDVLVRIDPRDYQARVDMARAALVQAQSQVVTSRTMVPMTNESTRANPASPAPRPAKLSEMRTAELDRARLGYEQASSSEIAVAEANVHSKQASNDRAQADLARMKPLLDKEEISRQQYDSYQAQARVAESELTARARAVEVCTEQRQYAEGCRHRGAVAGQSGAIPSAGFDGQSQTGGRAAGRNRNRFGRSGSCPCQSRRR